MELQFQNNAYSCLREVAREIKNEEQTQEIKLPDMMPDIGKVLGAWGQILLRGKEWRGSGMNVSGGVLTWVLYMPENETQPRSVEAWIPFQMCWDFPETKRDGMILADCLLRSIDARTVSARKLMVRSVVSVAGKAMEPTQAELYAPTEVPEDVCLLQRSYPMQIPRESGEKIFELDEELQVPASCQDLRKLMHWSLQPEMIDQKVMADKVVFRGSALVHALCCCEDGKIKACDFEVPFSQYAELEREYDPNATAYVIPAVTNLDMELQENGGVRLKAGLVGQYLIYDRPLVEVVEDAYSTGRKTTLHSEQLWLPTVLQQQQAIIKAEQVMDGTIGEIVEASFTTEHPRLQRREDTVEMELPGIFQLLYYDADGNLQSSTGHWEGSWEMIADTDTTVDATCRISGRAQAAVGAEGTHLSCDLLLDSWTVSDSGMDAVVGMELGEPILPDDDRPSLILCRAGTGNLWDMAKRYGSTEDAIRVANGLTQDPEAGRILLIPVS